MKNHSKEEKKYRASLSGRYSSDKFEKEYTYEGKDLGLTVGEELTFKVWAPAAEKLVLNIYEAGNPEGEDLLESREMTAGEKGVFALTAEKELLGRYYTYSVTRDGQTLETVDPYARATGVNGFRAMILDLRTTDPEGWEEDRNPHENERITDAVICELSVRDVSADPDSGIRNVGKFLGLAETGTKTPDGKPTGLDHYRELGVTHLQLLPIFDFGSIDESQPYDSEVYNWGYDPVNYNVPEGSYSTDPFHGEVRVKELKQMVKTLHENGLSVVMDVVYNHVYSAEEFSFNKIVPYYFSRVNGYGNFSNGSGCGNDTASERSMVRKFIVDSVFYWATEYHIDGFRFDLVGLLDVDTINAIVDTVREVRPDVIFYGEGWHLHSSLSRRGVPLANQGNASKTPGFGYFNDTARDAIKGHVFEKTGLGYVSGRTHSVFDTRNSWLARTRWSHRPDQIIQYVSCHDNLALFDKLAISRQDVTEDVLVKMNNLAAAIYLTSQGVPLFMAGEEMLRSKLKEDGSFDSNSYVSPDSVNAIHWSTLSDPVTAKTFEYYKGLIAFRRAHPSLRLASAEEITANISSPDRLDEAVLAFNVIPAGDDPAEGIFVVFNPNTVETTVRLPAGAWKVCVDADRAGTETLNVIESGEVTVPPLSATLLVKGEAEKFTKEEENMDNEVKEMTNVETAVEVFEEAVPEAGKAVEEAAANAEETAAAAAEEAASEIETEEVTAEAAAESAEETAEPAAEAEETAEAAEEAEEAEEESGETFEEELPEDECKKKSGVPVKAAAGALAAAALVLAIVALARRR